MAMKVSAPDGVKVYNVTSGKSMPEWLSDKKKRALRKDSEYTRRLELLQDFGFPSACQRLKVSPDQQYIFATGYHPPMLKVYDLANLSLKFDRHLDAEVVDFQILTDDYSKAAFLCADRSIYFHARFGTYFKVRTPRQGRDLAYAPFLAELLVVGSAAEVYRVSLEEGRFMQPLAAQSPGINACGISPVHGLFAAAGEDGILQCWDLRQRAALGSMDAAAAAGAAGQGLSALRFDDSGLHLAVGTSGGLVALFDLRSQRPLLVKDHMYGATIRDIKFHSQGGEAGAGLVQRHIISADKHIVKIWDQSSGKGYTSIEPGEGDINDVAVWPHSGLVMLAADARRVGAYFIPSLGPAPRWCSFLEGLTEELEEAAPSLYDDYRFVTRAELARLGLDHLMGTALLRAYMHGFFIDNRLYSKAADLAAPLGYEQYRQQRVAAKMEEERRSRIGLVRKLPKVNKQLAARLLAQEEEEAAAAQEGGDAPAPKRRKGDLVVNPLADERFKAMFEEEEFAIDEESPEYRLLHPNAPHEKSEQERLLSEHFQEMVDAAEEDSEEEDGPSTSGGSEGGGADSAASQEPRQRRPDYKQQKRLPPQQQQQQKRPAHQQQQQGRPSVKQRTGPTMYAAKDAAAAQAFRRGELLSEALQKPLGERVATAAQQRPFEPQRLGGSKEMTFVPSGGGRGRGRGRGGGGGRGRGAGGPAGGGGRGGGGGGRGGGGRGRGGARGRGRGGGRGRGR